MWLRLQQICLVAKSLESVVDDLQEILGLTFSPETVAI